MFRARLRRIGGSLGLLVPKTELAHLHAKEGDELEVALFPPPKGNDQGIEGLVGLLRGGPPFERDRTERI